MWKCLHHKKYPFRHVRLDHETNRCLETNSSPSKSTRESWLVRCGSILYTGAEPLYLWNAVRQKTNVYWSQTSIRTSARVTHWTRAEFNNNKTSQYLLIQKIEGNPRLNPTVNRLDSQSSQILPQKEPLAFNACKNTPRSCTFSQVSEARRLVQDQPWSWTTQRRTVKVRVPQTKVLQKKW